MTSIDKFVPLLRDKWASFFIFSWYACYHRTAFILPYLFTSWSELNSVRSRKKEARHLVSSATCFHELKQPNLFSTVKGKNTGFLRSRSTSQHFILLLTVLSTLVTTGSRIFFCN
ncbi:hypothetical protein K1719_038884 [Acacia pycnantha]|nr:hypothetical protein K1719_038884 [Acacia pycnantha]